MAIPTNFQGLKEFGAGLRELSRATQNNVKRKALNKGAQLIADIAIDVAPVDEGDLKKSIVVSNKLTRSAKKDARRETKSQVEVHVGPSSDGTTGVLNYATNVEFGTAKAAPHSYMRPAWDAGKEQAFELIKSELADEIEKAAARAARKAARRGTGAKV